MKKPAPLLLCILFILLWQSSTIAQTIEAIVPVGGNAWVNAPAEITDAGLVHWADKQAIARVYFRVSIAQQIQLALRLRVPAGKSSISVGFGKRKFVKEIGNSAFDTVAIGSVKIDKPGYVQVNLQGISKTGDVYADVSDVIVKGIQPGTELIYVKPGSSYYFGRRGPSVHLNYIIPPAIQNDVKWFYSEITVPAGNDIIGSYFEADGFGEGYFGMQVNSPTERRVLFSIWSPFVTDDPKSIPDSMQVKMLKKGTTVHAGEFGDEGSGGQSYMNYPWQAGKAYGFLVCAEPGKNANTTTFTAWFKDISTGKWYLIASFKRPKTLARLKHIYSFLENFDPEKGDKTRMAFYHNQWAGDSADNWHVITEAKLTADATANSHYRKDYAGGLKDGKLYLKNCGFFNDFEPLLQLYKPTIKSTTPVVDLKALPQN
ncbi:DUF3472 domain-containing protein [Mucilaginibacter gynuensis]|uniref:DUF3472 domain-containing protein n=1 Tax=Mucilaginibacter gynuensis TaxID=1302236 RepID=A0ABP8HDA3_9SPHI